MILRLRQFIILALMLVCACIVLVHPALAQSYTLYSVTYRSIPLNEALAEFSSMTGKGVSFDPTLIDSRRSTCAINEAQADEVLKCILAGTALDFIQLSSGTYVITRPTQQQPLYGTIAGDIQDEHTGFPLSYAHVMLASNTTEVSTITNQNGQFTLPPLLPGRYFLSTTHLGYHDKIDTLVVLPGKHSFKTISMSEEPIVFAPVVIDGLQRRQSAESLDHSMLLRADSLSLGQFSSSESITQQIASIPGVRINDLTADAHLQGSEAGEHQFRLDGVPIFMPQRAIGILGPFSPFALASIRVHKSGFSVEEGSYLAGVVDARQTLSSQRRIDMQMDPLSFNGRYLDAYKTGRGKNIELMLAGRTSLWSMYQHPQLQSTLDQWSRPDPFLIFGPLKRYEEINPVFFEEVLKIQAQPTTRVTFSDLHFAGKIDLSPFSALQFSGYNGTNQLDGYLPGLFSSENGLVSLNGPEADMEFSERSSAPAPLSVSDQYKWKNSAGQINYHTLIGQHTLLNIQVRASNYSLKQNYQLVDGLSGIINALPEPDQQISEDEVYEFPVLQLQEQNKVFEYAIEGRLEHAFNRHYLTGGFALTRTESLSDLLLPSLIPDLVTSLDPSQVLAAGLERVASQSNVNRSTTFIQDRIELGDHATAEIGTRLTYFFSDSRTYLEPRAAIRFDGRLRNGGTFAARTAVGVFRQYLLQFDVSTLNAGTLFPSKRIWLPVDYPILPPRAYHFSQSFLLAPSAALTIRLEGYAKLLDQTYTLNYISSSTFRADFNTEAASSVASNEFISLAESVNLGGSFALSWSKSPFFAQLIYDFSAIQRKSAALFENSWTTVPWNEPHRLNLTLQTELARGLLISSQFTGVWGRSWGFRQAYYDFFGHRSSTRNQDTFDFGNPEDHVLPAIYQLDLGLAYNLSLPKNKSVQFRFDVVNALNRKNVADWRLLWNDGALEKENRYLYPRIPSAAIRLSL